MPEIWIADIVNYIVDIDLITDETKTRVSFANVAEPVVWTKHESEDK